MVQAKKFEQRKNVKYYAPQSPNFVKIKKGEAYEGIFLGTGHTTFGVSYNFADCGTGERFTIGGNRAQLDQVFQELLGNPVGYPDQTLIGHKIEVARLPEDAIAKGSGNQVAQYVIAHIKDGCPKKCK